MISKAIIVGCGRVGSNLAILLSKKQISEIILYDSDSIGLEDKKFHIPFNENHKGLNKVDVVSFLCRYHSKDKTKVTAYNHRVSDVWDLNSSYFIFDCRDSKSTCINSSLSISLDGKFLILDGTGKVYSSQEPDYMYEKNDDDLSSALNVIDNYLENRMYQVKTRKLFILNDPVESYIL